MKYEEIIRKFIKSYKSKRELKNELEVLERYKINEYKTNVIKITTDTREIIPIVCKRSINRFEINYLNEQERNTMYERIKYGIQRELFDYLVENNLVEFRVESNLYECCDEFIGTMKVVR